MAANYVLLEKITVGAAGASSVTFSGIPQTGYTDLVMKYSTRSTYTGGTANTIQIGFNSSTANFTGRTIEGDGASATSSTSARNLGATPSATATASTFSNGEVYIPNYTSANYKSFSVDNVQEDNVATAYSNLNAGLWAITSAITSIEVYTNVTTWAQYSTFYLYGVAALGTTPVIVPYATGGDTIMTDGTYWYHTFVSSGTFTPAKALTVDYLVVAGGGGGGGNIGGGGGAGGFRTSTGFSCLSSVGLTVTVGAGGASSSDLNASGGSGSNSVFSTITSAGGGGGGGDHYAGQNGGSGGGEGQGGAGTGNTPSTSPSQGNNGGTRSGTSKGGGGGASAVGGNGGAAPGAGGAGTSNSYSGSAVTYAGGGGGGYYSGVVAQGLGGAGGGGNGGMNNGATTVFTATAGTANTGGGGGGAGWGGGTPANGASGAGGSGIVLVRYAV